MDNKQEIALLIKRNAWDRAEQLCQTEILRHPDDPETWFYLGAVQSACGRRQEAIRSLKAAASYAPSKTSSIAKEKPLLLRVAQALLRLRAYAEALSLYQRLNFALPEVVLGLGRCQWGMGEYESAMARFSGLWEAMPKWSELGLTYARALASLGQHDEAGDVLRQLLEYYPNEAELLQQYTLWVLSDQGVGAASTWLKQHPAGTPTPKLALMQLALSQLVDGVDDTPRITLNERLRSQWESHQMLRSLAGSARWLGDNTALLREVCQQIPSQGLIVECGVFHGRSLRLLAQWSQRSCHGFDSFAGLPEAWSEQEPAGAYSTDGQCPTIAGQVELHSGWFEETLPPFTESLAQNQQSIALLHVDCDLYSSTRTVLQHLMPYLEPGAIVVFDDFAAYPEWREHEYKAWMEYCQAHSCDFQLHAAVLLGRAAAFVINK